MKFCCRLGWPGAQSLRMADLDQSLTGVIESCRFKFHFIFPLLAKNFSKQ